MIIFQKFCSTIIVREHADIYSEKKSDTEALYGDDAIRSFH